MDRLDIAIIREMSQSQAMLPAKLGLRSSYRDMARNLKVSPGTVRNRVAKLYSYGILTGSSVYVNPTLLNLKGGSYAVDVASKLPKSEVVDKLKLIDGMVFIHNFHGSLVGIFFVYGDNRELEKKLSLFRSLAGAEEGLFNRVLFPECNAPLTANEWLLIARLSKEGFQSYAQLARELDTTIRTLKRRMSKILNARAVLSSPTLNYRAITGGVPADIIVAFTTSNAKNEAQKNVLHLVGEFLFFAGIGEDYMVYNLVLPNMSRVADLARSIKRIDGVKMVRAELVDEHIDLTKRLGNLFRIQKSQSTFQGTAVPESLIR